MKLAVAFLLAGTLTLGVAPGVASPRAAQGHGIDFGVVTIDTPTAKDFTVMKRGGVAIDRFLLYWPNVQGSAGPCTAASGSACDWASNDRIVARAAKHRVALLPFLYGTPVWASHRHGSMATRFDPLLTNEGKAGWKEFVGAAVNRYGPGGAFWSEHPGLRPDPVRHWQVWNEQNSSNSFRPNPSAKAYAKLLKVTSRKIRAAQPGADVLLGGMFGTPGGGGSPGQTAWQFLDKLYGVAGVKPSFDAVAVHPYSPSVRGVKYQLDRVRRVVKSHGDAATETWVTELGWGSDAKGSDNPLVKSPKGQKKLLVRSFRMLNQHRQSWNIAGVAWFSWRDPVPSPLNCEFCRSAGLFTRHFKPKPAWKAFTTFSGGHP